MTGISSINKIIPTTRGIIVVEALCKITVNLSVLSKEFDYLKSDNL